MKKLIISVAAFAALASSAVAGCGSCGSSCPGHYYPGQTFCTSGGGFGLNLFGGCNSCNSCARPACNTCGGGGYAYGGGYNGGYAGANVGPIGAGISY
jgi:hypothetical protein